MPISIAVLTTQLDWQLALDSAFITSSASIYTGVAVAAGPAVSARIAGVAGGVDIRVKAKGISSS